MAANAGMVEDSGLELDPAGIDHIFESMFTTKPDGMGMGLSISRSIIAAHGGRLWASPRDGFGAIFRITLPTDASGNGTVVQASSDPQVVAAQKSEAHGKA
jgi:signal transduction histidine kinase